MRTYLAAGTIAALVLLTAQPVARGQQQPQQGGDTSDRSNIAESVLGDSGESIFSELGSMERLEDRAADDVIGPSVEDAEAAMRAIGAQRAGQTSGAGTSRFGQGQQRSRRPTGRAGYGSRRRTEIRAKLRVGFNVIRPAPAQLGSRLAGRLEKSSWLQMQSPMQVAIEKGTAILRGTVATDHDRMLAERIARLEPGVRRVENQLAVAESPASPSPSDQPTVE